MAAQTNRAPTRPTGSITPPMMLVALLFVVLGAGAIIILISQVAATLDAIPAEGEGFGTTLLRFLNDYGIIIPLLLLGIGYFLIRLGINMYQRKITAATWGRQLLLWLSIAGLVLAAQAATSSGAQAGDLLTGISGGLIFLIVTSICFGAYWWLGNNLDLYEGQETLGETSSRSAWNLLLPTIIVLVLVAARPLEATFIASLTDRRFASAQEVSFVGFQNYAELLGIRFDTLDCERGDDGECVINENGVIEYPNPRRALGDEYRDLGYDDVNRWQIGEQQFILSARDDDFITSVGNTLQFTFVSVTLELILGLFIAMVINSKFPGRGIMRAAMLVPWAIPTVVSARLWEIMLRDNQSGVVNHFFTNIIPIWDSSQAWLANPDLQIWAVILVDVWKTTPFMALILLAGLQVIPSDVYEAADVDGASKIRQFFSITIPLLRPAIAVALVFRTLDAIRAFDVFNVLLGRQKLSMASYNYETLVQSQQLGYASAIGVVIFIIILVFAITYVRILGVEAD